MIEVKIGKPLAQSAPKNMYRFSLKVMFGDADGDAINSFTRENPEDFVPVILLLEKYAALDWNTQCDINESDAWAKMLGYDKPPSWTANDPKSEAFNTLMDLIPGDPCCDGQYQGSPQEWWISYFDQNGDEHECTFTVDGKKTAEGRSY